MRSIRNTYTSIDFLRFVVNKGILQCWGMTLFVVHGTGQDEAHTIDCPAMFFGEVLYLCIAVFLEQDDVVLECFIVSLEDLSACVVGYSFSICKGFFHLRMDRLNTFEQVPSSPGSAQLNNGSVSHQLEVNQMTCVQRMHMQRTHVTTRHMCTRAGSIAVTCLCWQCWHVNQHVTPPLILIIITSKPSAIEHWAIPCTVLTHLLEHYFKSNLFIHSSTLKSLDNSPTFCR